MQYPRRLLPLAFFLLGVLAGRDGHHDDNQANGTDPAEIVERVASAAARPTWTDTANNSSRSTASEPQDRLTGITAITSSRAGTIESSVVTVTVDPARTRVSSCIYGCDVITSVPKMATVTVLPATLPCSLLDCPPCGRVSRTINVPGHPVVTTITPPASQVVVTAPFTITYVTVTVTTTTTTTTTVTSCTATTCLHPAIVTVLSTSTITSTRSRSYTTLTRYSTVRITATPRPKNTACPPLPEKGQPAWDGSWGWNFKANHSEASEPKDAAVSFGEAIHQGPSTAMDLSRPAMATTTTVTVEKPLASTYTRTGSVCSTYIVCQPLQFSCPTRVQALEQVHSFIRQLRSSEADRSSRPSMAGVILQNLPPPRAAPTQREPTAPSYSPSNAGHVPVALEHARDTSHESVAQDQPSAEGLAKETRSGEAGKGVGHEARDAGRGKVQGAVAKNSGTNVGGLSVAGSACLIFSSLLLRLLG